jgi:hypothetical protein
MFGRRAPARPNRHLGDARKHQEDSSGKPTLDQQGFDM